MIMFAHSSKRIYNPTRYTGFKYELVNSPHCPEKLALTESFFLPPLPSPRDSITCDLQLGRINKKKRSVS